MERYALTFLERLGKHVADGLMALLITRCQPYPYKRALRELSPTADV
jgi:hypothetical protein